MSYREETYDIMTHLHEDEGNVHCASVRSERLLPIPDHRRLEALVIDGLATVFLSLVPHESCRADEASVCEASTNPSAASEQRR